jgi:hypothetical protein
LPVDQLHRAEDVIARLADVEDAAHSGIRNLPYLPDLVQDLPARVGGGRKDDHQRHRRSEDEIVARQTSPIGATPQPRDHPVPAGKHVARDEARCFKRRQRRGHCSRVYRPALFESSR